MNKAGTNVNTNKSLSLMIKKIYMEKKIDVGSATKACPDNTITIVPNKISRKVPYKINLVRNAASLSPNNIVKKEEEYVVRFGSLADKRNVPSKVKASVSDSAKMQNQEFTDYVNIHCKYEFLKFTVLSDKLDTHIRFHLPNKNGIW